MANTYLVKHGVNPADDVSDRIQLGAAFTTNAEEGSVATSTVVIEDPQGDFVLKGLRSFLAYEDEVPGDAPAQLIYRGFTADRAVSRGEGGNRTAGSRNWKVNIVDQNTLLSRRIFRGSAAKRPAETDVERMQWLMGTSAMSLIDNTDYLATTGPIAMDAVDYGGQTGLEVVNDCMQASGKNCWIMYLGEIGNVFGIWYDFDYSTAYPSLLSISNVIGDVDGETVFYPWLDAELTRDPSRVYSGVDMTYEGGHVYVEREATRDEFYPRDTTSYSPNVKSSTKATARSTRYLNSIATEEDRITCTVMVPNDKVNMLREGHRVLCKFSHLPGYEDWTWMRALNRTVAQESEEFYKITVTMSAEPSLVPECPMPTESGYYPALGGTAGFTGVPNTDPDGYTGYNTAGQSVFNTWPPLDRNTTYVGKWNFPRYQEIASQHGGPYADVLGTQSGNQVSVVVIGAGTLTCHVIPWDDETITFDAQLYYWDFDPMVNALTLVESQFGLTVGEGIDVVFSIPGAPECAYVVLIDNFLPGGHGLGWDGFTFVSSEGSGPAWEGSGTDPAPGGDDSPIFTPTNPVVAVPPSITQSEFLTACANMSYGTIELRDGTYPWENVDISVDRTANPLTIRAAAGAAAIDFVGPATTSGIIFLLGQTSMARYIAFDGRPGGVGSSVWTFKDIELAQSGVIEPRGSSHCSFSYLKFSGLSRNSAGGNAAYKSYGFYISAGGSGSNDELVLDHIQFLAPASSKEVSAMQVASSGSHGHIKMSNISIADYFYGLAVDVPVANLELTDWTMTGVGSENPITLASIRFFAANINGSYTNIVATGSEGLLDSSTGTMTDGGGNSGI